jgi:RNA polymerase sigma-70 factor, ECF subfamily
MRAHQDMVYTTAYRLTGSAAQAQDISQEVFLKAYETFSQLRDGAAAGGWLRTVATNLTLNHLTRYRRRWRLFSELAASDSEEERVLDTQTPELPDASFAELDAVQRSAAIEAALCRLPQHQRVPLVLYHFEEMSYQDIARKLHVSLSKTKTDIRRAREALLPLLRALHE